MSYQDTPSFVRLGISGLYAAMTRGERLVFWVAIINFVIFVAIAIPLGGDALNGTVRDGHYFLMQHGRYTEVSRPVFLYSVLHTLSVIVTTLAAVAVQIRARLRANKEVR